MIENVKDPLIVSAIFFAASSSWFNDWLMSLIPSAADNPLMWGLIKTAAFAAMYWLYRYMTRENGGSKSNRSSGSSSGQN
ncbi:hypothetical protein [Dasineura jujubifolia toursvirus 2a]|nr:hypothetical protein [Dasineura jujubifolia toursvirus 2a]